MLKILSNNRIIGASFSLIAGTEDAKHPLTNLLHPHTTKVFRATGSTATIQLDLGESKLCNTIAVLGSIQSELGVTSLTLTGADTLDFSNATAIPVDLSAKYGMGLALFPLATFRYWRLTAENTAGAVELGHVTLAKSADLDSNGFSLSSFQYAIKDNSSAVRNKYGQAFHNIRNKTKELSGSIEYVNKAEFQLLDPIFYSHSTTQPLWVIADPDSELVADGKWLFSHYGYLKAHPRWRTQGPSLFSTKLAITGPIKTPEIRELIVKQQDFVGINLAADHTTAATSIPQETTVGIIYESTGTAVGELKVEVSNNATDWQELTFPQGAVAVNGVTNHTISLADFGYAHIRFRYVSTSGTGTASIRLTAKG